MNNTNKQQSVNCPKCGAQFDVHNLLYQQVEKELRKTTEENLEKQKKELEKDIRKSVTKETSDQTKAMQDELDRKSQELKAFNKTKIDMARLKREKDELEEKIRAEAEQKLNKQIEQARHTIRKDTEDKFALKLEEKDKKINQIKNELQEAQRKADQGSMQLQGEVQELAIERWLKDSFPLDTITEIKAGARGADCLHTVNTRTHQNCGSIYYESKRTKSFQPIWIEKFKEDLKEKDATIGVIVTEAMPPNMDRMGLWKDIWICSFEEFKGLCAVLRESLIQVHQVVATQENKGDKMNLLYKYLTSNEFKLQIEAIVEGFTQMKTDLDSERRAIEGTWKKREKQIMKVLHNTIGMHGSIKGIAGNAVPSIPQLELPQDNALEDSTI